MSIAVKADARVERAVVTQDLITFYLKDGRVVALGRGAAPNASRGDGAASARRRAVRVS